MANPRQRRKTRSGTHKAVQHSRRAKTLLKKQPPLRGPKALQDAWDPRKTVRQNYEALGLAASLNPIASGGTEKRLGGRAAEGERGGGEDAPVGGSSTVGARPAGAEAKLPKGWGRIIRDAEGNVVDIELADEEEAGVDEAGDGLDEVADPREDGRLAGWVAVGALLEQLSEARAGQGTRRHASQGELALLRALVAKHGEDVEEMARDRRANVEQRTAGELRRAIRKAGGLGALAGAD
ncbi:ribosome biogenesis protein Nop16 [Epithele typhae]|uniref:ribosome biogenesis protein Nop16 n=1 Tax=Epithele typhae TaxID=378194 RepID=UPI0020080722|nr:ribosome biogenesis protein Nop16 [Epithele typhae]KAH9946222.1 ribosome biogenesis protein Nop16 [Epithele typhae]